MTAFGAPRSNEKDRQEAKTLIDAADDAMDIRKDPSKPFVLEAHFAARDVGDGSYKLEWSGQDKWRETITLPKASQIKVRNGDQLWTQRNPPTPSAIFPEVVRELALTTRSHPVTWIDNLKNTTLGGRSMRCADVSRGKGLYRVECVDASTGLFARYKDLDPISATKDQVVEFGDFVSFGTKHFPGSIRSSAGPLSFDLRVDSLKQADFGDSPFAGIPGVRPWPTCDNMQPPVAIQVVDPTYSDKGRQKKIRGSVALIASVGSDGIVHDAQVTKSLEPSLDQQALKAVKNWKFTPAQCGDRYVPAEIGVETKFDIF